MEAVSIKFEEDFLRYMEKTMKKHRYSTKAEFIREAIREKLNTLEKQEYALQAIKLYGKGKKHRHITDEDLHKAREKAVAELERELA